MDYNELMNRIKNFLFNTNLIWNVTGTVTIIMIVCYVMNKYFGYGGLIETILFVTLFLLIFFVLFLIFVDKEKAKTLWFICGLGALSGLLGLFG